LSWIHYPLGMGLGSTTLAASKFGGANVSSEMDLGDIVISAGIPGAIAYAVVMCLTFGIAFRVWNRTRSLVALGTVGVLAANFGHWLQGGYYIESSLIWLAIGTLDQIERNHARSLANARVPSDETAIPIGAAGSGEWLP